MKPSVTIIATGGTIAGTAPSSTQAGYTSGKLDINNLIQTVPNLERLARIDGEQFSNVGSQDMSFEIMINLARRINKLLIEEKIDGVVVTHGTDTMEETAFFLNLTIKSPKPVVMTGAMRPFTALSADGPLNLYNAVAVAADPRSCGQGVMVVMNDRIHDAHSLSKTNTTSVETFLSPVNGLLGTVIYGALQYYRGPFQNHTTSSEFSLKGVDSLPRVDIIYACADMPPDLIDCSVASGAKGIVIAGYGNGNMNETTLKKAAQMAQQGIFIIRSSRVPTGRVVRNVEVDDDINQFIASDELNPAKARILLILALLKKRSFQQVQDLFYSY
ncbi:MAG: asparaginase [Desulfobacteraceae bacterium]|nr:asparaginase [Desulfobacteraceae bacterium]